MLKKERWIVYPLLMLSLFSAFAGVRVIKAQSEVLDVLTVRGIQIVNEQNTPVVQITSDSLDGGGVLIVSDENGKWGISMVAKSDFRGIGVVESSGDLGIVMGSDEKGGMIEGYGKEGALALRITPYMLTYYENYVTGGRSVGSELSAKGLEVKDGHSISTRYAAGRISYNGFFGFELPRDITN